MAISKNGWTICALLLTLIILETGNVIELSSPALPGHYDEEYFLPHTREKRNLLPEQWNYIVDVVVNGSNVETFEQFEATLNATTFPIELDNNTDISDISITTVCSSTATGFQCRCGEQYAWPYSICILYGACDYISSGICKCISALPADGQFCQPISVLLAQVEYTVDVELNVSDIETVDYIRSLLNNGSYSLVLSPTVNVTHIDITTVCYPNGSNIQCRCEDQYVWPNQSCATYGACDDIIDNTCGCINAIPFNGQYCEPKKNTVQLYEYILDIEVNVSSVAVIEQLRDTVQNISFPVQLTSTISITQITIVFTAEPLVFYEYQILVEVNTTNADQLRSSLQSVTFPIPISAQTNISEANITTVCSQVGTDLECRCEDDYLWPCNKCATHGKCDGDANTTCRCIKAFPTDGQYCQSTIHQNFSVCPVTTISPSPDPLLYKYLISVELNVSDVAVINQLRRLLSNISYPININNRMQISELNITTVCSPSSGGYQCRCEDQYRWSCDKCFLHGLCDNITDDTCGCISGIPPDGQYCQSADQHNFTACPTPPPPTPPPLLYKYLISVELNISDVAVINQLRRLLSNISYPININNRMQISELNITTVCSPSSGGYQCRCEDQYRWSCDKCFLHGLCDNITDDTCGCISGIPPDGQYCQSADQHNFTACPTPPPPTPPPLLYKYLISVELNISDVAVINQLRRLLSNISYPININNRMQISELNITTVCSPSSGGYQCRCEDQYRWSCDKCFLHGLCDNITDDTCGCISGIPPDGQYCQSADQHNFTACPTPPPPTPPPLLYKYLISVELNVSDVAVINQLRRLLSNISYPISINNRMQISELNITTVCSLSSGWYQCRCEDQYRWSCDQCFLHGPCDNITDDTCGCISGMPPDGQYCQSADQHNFTACPATTSPPTSTNSTPFATTDLNTTIATTPPPTIVTNVTLNTTTPTVIPSTTVTNLTTTGATTEANTTTTFGTNSTSNTTTHLNTTTPTVSPATIVTNSTHNITTPTMPPTNSTTAVNTTTLSTTPPTIVTNSTPTTTTHQNTTTTPSTSTTVVTNSTPDATTHMNTTAAATPTSTTIATIAPTTTSATTLNTTVSSATSMVTSTPASTTTRTTTTATTPTPTTTTINTTTISTTTTDTSATSIISTTTAATTTPAFTTLPTSTTVTGFDVEMSIKLNLTYTSQLSDSTSPAYKELESKIRPVLQQQYGVITGFINVFVMAFRQGSIITDFVVQTANINSSEMKTANDKLIGAMASIAPVIGSVTASYNSPIPISVPNLTYTGDSMRLTCSNSENIDVGQISGAMWKFNGLEIKNSTRFQITTSSLQSFLTVNNVILADNGSYECTLMGIAMNFIQTGTVTRKEIMQAPILRLNSKVNVKCEEGWVQQIQCCVQPPYHVKWFQDMNALSSIPIGNGECMQYGYKLQSCSTSLEKIFTCKVDEATRYQMTTTMTIFRDDILCNDTQYGSGRLNDESSIGCDEGQEGSKTAVCQETGKWKLQKDSCIITQIKELFIESQDLTAEEVPQLAMTLNTTVKKYKTDVANSSATISTIVGIISNIANVSNMVSETIMMYVLDTVDDIIGDDARESWAVLNANETQNASSELLASLENLSDKLVEEFNFATQRIMINRTMFNKFFTADLNSSVIIDIPNTNSDNVAITTITFATLNNVMPARDSTFNVSLFNTTSNETITDNAINAAVVLVQLNATITNVTLTFDKLNNSLSLNPQCVFWNFTLLDKLGAWDNEGCTFVSDINDMVTCRCNHLTSFSILMATDIPPELRDALDVITYVGVGISLASLVICLIIEGYVWKAITRNSTAFMRHVSIVNTALSLLIADICFIIAASIAKNPLENPGENHKVPVGPCSTATFFMHFFYLALFFWMLVSGLLLFYRTVLVFSHMSKSTMMAVGFSLGYGCPLIIAVITVAVTAPGKGYIRGDQACWLNWFETKALLALVIPALTIVFINIMIVIVVLFKMLRRGVGDTAQTDEKHTLVVIARCVIILTPLFGLTWSLGVGTMISSTNKGIHIAFAFFNSLQGFFILVFGTLFDSKVRSILSRRLPTSSTASNPTRSTSGGISSLSGLNWISRLRGRRYVYRVSEAANSSSAGASESFVNI